jgi:hypothetical protein
MNTYILRRKGIKLYLRCVSFYDGSIRRMVGARKIPSFASLVRRFWRNWMKIGTTWLLAVM